MYVTHIDGQVDREIAHGVTNLLHDTGNACNGINDYADLLREIVRTQCVNFARFDALETCRVIVEIIRRTGEGSPDRAMLRRKTQLGSGRTEQRES